MLTIDPKNVQTRALHPMLLGAVGPRPIALASTIDVDGKVNLSPYSFFNVFSANPPVVIFSPARRVRDNTIKHTLINCEATKEVVINIVSYDMVQQMSLSSTEYAAGVNEFTKAGFTEVKSEKITPPRVGESPAQLECVVKEIVPMGDQGGAGNLIICEVVMMHVNENVLDQDGKIDQHKIDQVGRMGGNWYVRANQGMFEVPKPLSSLGIGVDAIPESIRLSSVLTGNDLGQLGNVDALPMDEDVSAFAKAHPSKIIENKEQAHRLAQQEIAAGNVTAAWNILLVNHK